MVFGGGRTSDHMCDTSEAMKGRPQRTISDMRVLAAPSSCCRCRRWISIDCSGTTSSPSRSACPLRRWILTRSEGNAWCGLVRAKVGIRSIVWGSHKCVLTWLWYTICGAKRRTNHGRTVEDSLMCCQPLLPASLMPENTLAPHYLIAALLLEVQPLQDWALTSSCSSFEDSISRGTISWRHSITTHLRT